jgi:translation initiation factor IF-2
MPAGNRQKLRQQSKTRGGMVSKKRETEAERLQRIQLEKARKIQLTVNIPDEISAGELAVRLKVNSAQVIKKLMSLGVMASVSEMIDFDTASLVADELGAKVQREVHVTIEERLFEEEKDSAETLQPRSPVVVVMGHVDHGKTSILDAIRKAQVTSGEAGGITQHIGAYQVEKDDKKITFLDTPGHEAFTSMRARGANLTDIAVLVVAADDGIMPQTIESINHAKAAGVSIIVAINKIDKQTANPDKVKQQLTEHGLVTEEWGGDTVIVPVSAHTGEGIDDLLEMINLTAEVKELMANPNRKAKGAVIEARLDKGQGPIATILVQHGTLVKGDVVIAGSAVGHVRTMRDAMGNNLEEAGPSTPVEITGLTDVPAAGDEFDAVEDERLARLLADKRQMTARNAQLDAYTKVTLDNLFSQIEAGEKKELAIIVKADVQGSAEAVKQSLERLSGEEVQVRVIHTGVGGISKSDVMLASASGAIIIGFNVRPDPIARAEAAQSSVEMRMYTVIYDAINDVSSAIKGMLSPKTREVEQARVEVRQVIKVSSIGAVAGCYVLDGKITRQSKIRLVRDGIVVAEDELKSLRRFKDDVKEVAQGYECGIVLEKYSDVKEGDIFEAYIIEEYRD